jgi:hypothetical protein
MYQEEQNTCARNVAATLEACPPLLEGPSAAAATTCACYECDDAALVGSSAVTTESRLATKLDVTASFVGGCSTDMLSPEALVMAIAERGRHPVPNQDRARAGTRTQEWRLSSSLSSSSSWLSRYVTLRNVM